jgi:hypothetical protein
MEVRVHERVSRKMYSVERLHKPVSSKSVATTASVKMTMLTDRQCAMV